MAILVADFGFLLNLGHQVLAANQDICHGICGSEYTRLKNDWIQNGKPKKYL